MLFYCLELSVYCLNQIRDQLDLLELFVRVFVRVFIRVLIVVYIAISWSTPL